MRECLCEHKHKFSTDTRRGFYDVPHDDESVTSNVLCKVHMGLYVFCVSECVCVCVGFAAGRTGRRSVSKGRFVRSACGN